MAGYFGNGRIVSDAGGRLIRTLVDAGLVAPSATCRRP